MPGRSDEAIRIRAYEIWVAEGRPHGRDWDHWLQAAAEIEAERGEAPKTEAMKTADAVKGKTEAKPVGKTTKTAAKAPARGRPRKAATKVEPEAALALEAAPESTAPASAAIAPKATAAPRKPRATRPKTAAKPSV